jgi:hypothetical protein
VAKKKCFWITNMCNRNVSLSDLNLTVKAFSSINLLDKKHYYYTLSQLEKSAKSGSLYKKRHLISVRVVEPIVLKMDIPFRKETYIDSRERSVLEIKEESYEELNLSDEQFAAENSEL